MQTFTRQKIRLGWCPRQTFWMAIFCTVCFCVGCGQGSPSSKRYQKQLLVFGTLVDITIQTDNEQLATQGTAAISQLFEALHAQLHSWEPSQLQAINHAIALNKSIRIDQKMADLIRSGTTLSLQSGELFNPAIGKLVSLWGFHAQDWKNQPPPSTAQLTALVKLQPNMRNIRIDQLQLTSNNRSVQLDFGAFGKGYAIDQGMQYLQNLGIQNAIINTGGDLRAMGSKAGKPWRIGIRHPRKPGIIATIATQGDESIFTSGDYERYYTYQGVRYHHIIDPRTGWPAQGTRSVTVIHSPAQAADAAATALFVAGPEKWFSIARTMGVKYVLLIDDKGYAHMTPNMQKRIQWASEIPVKVHLSPPL